MGAGVPQEGGKVVLHRTATSSLEVYEAGFTILNYYVAGLEIPVHEGVAFEVKGIHAQLVNVVLEPDFVELQPGELEEVVFEIIKVKVHHTLVELAVRETYAPVQAFADFELHCRKQGHRVVEPVQLLLAELSFGNIWFQQLKQLPVAQIFLKIGHRVVGHGENFRRVQPGSPELPVYREESLVFCRVRTFAGYEGSAFAADTIIFSCTAGEGKEFFFLRFAACQAAV